MIYILLDEERNIVYTSYSKGKVLQWLENNKYSILYIEETDWDKIWSIRGKKEDGLPCKFTLEIHQLD